MRSQLSSENHPCHLLFLTPTNWQPSSARPMPTFCRGIALDRSRASVLDDPSISFYLASSGRSESGNAPRVRRRRFDNATRNLNP